MFKYCFLGPYICNTDIDNNDTVLNDTCYIFIYNTWKTDTPMSVITLRVALLETMLLGIMHGDLERDTWTIMICGIMLLDVLRNIMLGIIIY